MPQQHTHCCPFDALVAWFPLSARKGSVACIRSQVRCTPVGKNRFLHENAAHATTVEARTHLLSRTYKSPMRPTNSATSTAALRAFGYRNCVRGLRYAANVCMHLRVAVSERAVLMAARQHGPELDLEGASECVPGAAFPAGQEAEGTSTDADAP